ncbi:hypothetical protein GTP46_24330 [Duganella sp. FT135W]|uniref:Uncharacterized protein n=1 Tax=Duganella flavida TaxID=2692175 RepID=A0A6L8KFG2_9BURK|nr:hypothetical protein [Duganella flavida]MYM25760.1 hypothetical protein [Duganella flavida]
MKFPPKNSRGRTILEALLAEPATIYQGIERHGLLSLGQRAIQQLYDQLELDQCLIKIGVVYKLSTAARTRLVPEECTEEAGAPAEPAYRGNWQGPAMTAASARRSGAAFGLDWIRQ